MQATEPEAQARKQPSLALRAQLDKADIPFVTFKKLDPPGSRLGRSLVLASDYTSEKPLLARYPTHHPVDKPLQHSHVTQRRTVPEADQARIQRRQLHDRAAILRGIPREERRRLDQ